MERGPSARSRSLFTLLFGRTGFLAAPPFSGQGFAQATAEIFLVAVFIAFDDREHFFGPFDHPLGHTGKPRHLNTVASVGAAFNQFSQKNDVLIPLFDGDVEVLHPGFDALKLGEFVVVGGKKGFNTFPVKVVEILGNGPGDA